MSELLEKAIDQAVARRAVPPAITLPLLAPLRLGPSSSLMVAGSDEVVLLLADAAAQGWHPVVLEPGSRWELREVSAELWTPGSGRG